MTIYVYYVCHSGTTIDMVTCNKQRAWKYASQLSRARHNDTSIPDPDWEDDYFDVRKKYEDARVDQAGSILEGTNMFVVLVETEDGVYVETIDAYESEAHKAAFNCMLGQWKTTDNTFILKSGSWESMYNQLKTHFETVKLSMIVTVVKCTVK